MFDVIAIGDTTQDVFLKLSDASVQCDIDNQNCKILLDYADKIAVDKKTDIPAVGNAANNVIGMARMGHRTAIYTVVGDDTQGHLAGDVFNEEGVDSRYVTYDKQRGTNFSAVINFKGERTILVYHEPREYRLPNFEPTKWVYLTSASGDGVESMHQQVLEYMTENTQVKLAFNPGTHQIHLGGKKLAPLLARTEMLFLNREESVEILGIEANNIKQLAQGFHDIGVKIMVITDGPEGAYISDQKKIWYLGIFDGPVVERTGAGDAFGSGLLGGLLHGESLADAMLWGNANSTSVVQHIGARQGLLTPEQAKQSINANATVRPTEFAAL